MGWSKIDGLLADKRISEEEMPTEKEGEDYSYFITEKQGKTKTYSYLNNMFDITDTGLSLSLDKVKE